MTEMADLFTTDQPIIGMVHLDPLPGAPRFDGDHTAIHERATQDAERLEAGGVDGIIVENFGDAPFHSNDVPKHVVAEMTCLVGSVCDTVDVPVGVNVLRNDGTAALSIAAATEASFIRVNVHTGARVTDQGLIEGQAHETLRLREQLDADVRILADVAVKHSTPVSTENVEQSTHDAVERGLADAVVVSGSGTGQQVDRERLETVAHVAADLDVPTYIGSGVTTETVTDLLSVADGAIVGSALKEESVTVNPVVESRVESLVESVRN
jgi:membrane complex biogenesis BtpA family protein